MLLQHLTQQARSAFNWTSFDPEKRGDRTIEAYSQELAGDIATLRSKGASSEQIERYKSKYEQMFSHWLSSHSRCASSAITGGSNFPVRRMQKYNNWERGSYERFVEWRDKVLRAYDRYERKQKIEEAGGELEIAKKKLKKLEAAQEQMKKVNAAHKAFLKKPETLDKADFSEDVKQMIRNYVPGYSWEKHPYAPYMLTNNNARIKQTKDRIAQLEQKEKQAETIGKNDFPFEGGKVVLNYEQDRLQIIHNEKPPYEKINELKKNGFRWSPFFKAWQRKLTNAAKHDAVMITGVNFTISNNGQGSGL